MNYNKIYLKITTVPNQIEVDFDSKEIQIFKDKYESHKSFLKDSDIELAYLNESAVNGSFARVFSISLGYIYENMPIVKTFYGEEKNLLDTLLSILRKDEFKDATLVMYNKNFILSFLSKRLRKHNYVIKELPVPFQVYDKKPWTLKGSLCIQEYVKGISYQTENFKETCFIEGIEPDIIEGSDIPRFIKKNMFQEIYQSDIEYLYSLMLVDNKLFDRVELVNLSSEIKEIGEVKPEEYNVLQHILSSGELSSKTIEAIVDFTEKENLNKENVLELVKAALSNTKTNHNVLEEDYMELRSELGLNTDYSNIEVVSDKGNLGKREAQVLINQYKDSSKEEKEEIVNLVTHYLTYYNKIGQARAKSSLEFLTKELLG